MNTNTFNGLMFLIAGFTPFFVYFGLGPDGSGLLNQARAEQLFAYLYFSLPIAFMMTRRIESNHFVSAGLIILIASMSMSMVADAFRADSNLVNVANAVVITAYSSNMLGAAICGVGISQTSIFPKWLSTLFAVIAGIAFFILATTNPQELDTKVVLLPFVLSFHVILIVLGVLMIRRSD